MLWRTEALTKETAPMKETMMQGTRAKWLNLTVRFGVSAAFLLLLMLLAAALRTQIASAQGPITPRHTDPNWQAVYWNNTTLFGSPALQRTESDLDHNWGSGSPAPQVRTDRFSARWTRYIDVTPGRYTFTALVDDGIRVKVDGKLIIDAWKEQTATRYSSTIDLGSGHHLVVVEYFENTGNAMVTVSWQQAPDAITRWKGEYFNNMSLSGPPEVVRDDFEIDFDWQYGSPAPGIDSDGFSVRWSRDLDLPAGAYRFTMTVDDGARLFVNGHTLIDAWKEQATTTYTGDIFLPGGPVTVQMEYFERAGLSEAHLAWAQLAAGPTVTPTPTPTGTPTPEPGIWLAEYWNNRFLSGSPVLVRREATIEHSWGGGSPAPGVVDQDNFSARWTGALSLTPGNYRFTLTVDDGARLYLNGLRVIDAWQDQASTTYSVAYWHGGGPLSVQLEYYEHTGNAVAMLRWAQSDGTQPTPTPAPGAVIVDDLDSGFVKGGAASGWAAAQEGYNGHLFWTQNNDRVRPGYNWGRWHPSLSSGRYEVFVYIPDRYTTTAKARYWISHAGGFSLRVVNQSRHGGEWVSLGTYSFRGTDQDYVSLADVTYEARLSRLMAWDAVKWVRR